MLPNVPQFGYNHEHQPGYSRYNDGPYLLWVKLTGDGCKDIFGCIVHDGKESATKVSDYIAIEEKKDNEQPKSNDDGTNKQDKSTESDKSASDADKGSNGGSTSSSTVTPKTDPEDPTTASKILPKTGKGIGIILSFIAIAGIGGFAYFRYKNLNYVK